MMSNLCWTQYRQCTIMIVMRASYVVSTVFTCVKIAWDGIEKLFGLVPTTIWRPGSSLTVSIFHGSQLRLIFK